MEKLKFLIFCLKQVPGLSNQSILNVCQSVLETGRVTVSPEEIIHLANIQKKYEKKILTHLAYVENQRESFYVQYTHQPFITFLDQAYPTCLSQIYNPPVGLFYAGDISLLNKPAISMIGPREPTQYGYEVVEKFSPKLVTHPLVIVSGLAKGIDTKCHQEALKNQGKTVAVIGSGLNICYPKSNQRLQHYLMKHQLVVSEYPLNTPPYPYHFPMRNRIIAGLSKGTCVIQAREKSGTLITASLALEEGREVFAVPGDIGLEESKGCLKLIQLGAKCVYQPEDILEEFLF
ncbi:DNA-processing protein DprA [Vagococcus humatus]|uniref:DNA-protecting protein DprA n=1 Tax=Vagococcus humatus TaxID=1889241 RepID=A0A3S0ACK6_9ENTE|nr:DNA-processing protein DprA [Vagococcus humatus]RST89680.1 DNA-protecting protein DprA [Vagococcus humatus]